MPEDFSPTYIHHLLTLVKMNPENIFIKGFYEKEKKCHQSMSIQRDFISRSIDIKNIPEADINSLPDNTVY